MTCIYYTKILKQLPKDIFLKYICLLPDELIDKNNRLKLWQDQHLNLFGKLLLLDMLNKNGYNKLTLEQIRYKKYSKPFFDSTIDFNISHSGEYVICAMTDNGSIGVDIEEIKPCVFLDFTNIMTREQWKIIENSNNPMTRFFEFWAIKESVIKADSRGLSIPLEEISIQTDSAFCMGKKWNIKKLLINKNYACYLATDQLQTKLQIQYVNYYP